MKRPDMPANPLQELAEKLVAVIGDTDTDEQFIEKALPILTASLGTLLQAERAAAGDLFIRKLTERIDRHDGEARLLRQTASITGYPLNETAWDYHIDCRTTLRGFFADVQHAATPEERSALSAVVQRETEKLREHLKWALNEILRLERFEDIRECPSCGAYAGDSEWPVQPHKPNCKFSAAEQAAK